MTGSKVDYMWGFWGGVLTKKVRCILKIFKHLVLCLRIISTALNTQFNKLMHMWKRVNFSVHSHVC